MSPHLPHNPHPRPKWPFWPHDPRLMLLGTDWMVNTMFNLFATPWQWLRPRIMENWWLGSGCFEVSVHIGFSFLHNLVLGKFWTEINVTDAKVPTPSGFLLPCQFPLKTGSEHLATAFITFIWKYYQPSQWSRSQCKSICATTSKEEKSEKKMHFTVWQ